MQSITLQKYSSYVYYVYMHSVTCSQGTHTIRFIFVLPTERAVAANKI